ncbi:MAG: PP2C family protein-serine/threonine phosphatase [Gemmataceae bacterium]
MKVLVAEDDRISRRMLVRDLVKWGHEVVSVENGQQAWQQYQETEFSIVLSDWMMPEMDGLELIRRIRESDREHYAFFILLTAKAQTEDIVEGMEAGADDFLTKPFDRTELRARLRAGERIIELERRLAERNKQLDEANQRMKRDLDAAATVQQSLLPTNLPSIHGVRLGWKFRPCDELAGDFLNVFQLDDKHLGLYVADVSGHGVAASLLSVAISRVLTPELSESSLLIRPQGDSGARTGIVPPSEVAQELNRRFPMEKSGEKYFTISYATLNTQTRELVFSSAGHPPIIHLRAQGEPQLLKQKSFAIGWFPETVYPQGEILLEPGDRLFLYSDGLNEARNGSAEQFSISRIMQCLAETREEPLEHSLSGLMQTIEAWCGASGPKDDLSLLGIELE